MTDTNKSETFTLDEAAELATSVGWGPAAKWPEYAQMFAALCNAAAQAAREKQEPVAWIDRQGFPHHISSLQPLTEMRFGKWMPLYTSPPVQAPLSKEIAKLTDEQRFELFSNYCHSCGRADPRCQCWNDE